MRLVVTSFIACWGARCCLQAHIRYRVKFVARVLECLLFASSCQLCCQVCSSFGSPATPRGKVVGTILRQRSCCGSLKSSNFSLAFYNIAEGGGGAPSKSHGFLYDKIAHFGGTSFSAAKSLKNGAVPHVTSPVTRGPTFWIRKTPTKTLPSKQGARSMKDFVMRKRQYFERSIQIQTFFHSKLESLKSQKKNILLFLEIL